MSKINRQESAKKRLEGQLASKVKTEKGTMDTKVPLTEKDVKRITKELEVLTSALR